MSGLAIDELTVRVREWRRTIRRTAEMLRGSTVSVGDYDPATHGSLITFTGVPGYEEVERYWVNAPFAFVSINYDSDANEHLYHVVEPELDDVEVELLERLFSDLRESLIYRREMGNETAETVLRDELRELLEVYGVEVNAATYYRLFYYLFRSFRGFGKLDPLINDPHIEDISCDGYDLPIFVYHDTYNDIGTNVVYSKDELDSLVVRLAQQSGQHVSVGEPVVEATLPDGSRAELALGEEVTPRGSAFTIRKYADEPFTPVDLVNYGTFNLDQMAYLWLAIENNKSLIFAGGTASGKTTSMNAISMFIPPRSKVLTIEDTRELTLYHDNWLSSVTRDRLDEGTDITMYDLLRSALRHRPEYIAVGEVRGEEAMTLFQAMNTGHTTYSTMHADSVQTVINRLENEPINVPRAMIQSLDILSIQSLTYVGEERLRRTQTLAEINGIDQRTGDLDYTTTFSWEPSKDTFRKRDSGVLDDIRRDHGWSQSELLTELRDRKLVLQYLRENGISDYRRFTGMVNEYYADPETVVSNVRESTDSAVAELD
ncbi:type II secretion system protein [Haladaptatus sp. W1]|uniref:type II/IV secretion system ATPase subunit n=1 Tax=Haladaptatus sp. W1 TaxID=1897478 RepID=UPI000849A5D2|nr:type II/IV secretion system ATPase subunit [Haladaptatus sp. W1]ODR82294.1 type II secretion system protein [Haladaptatus sp. W1]